MRKYYTIFISVLVTLCIVLALLLVSLKNTSAKNRTSPTTRYRIHVIIKAYRSAPDFWRIVEQGVEVAEDEFDLSCSVYGPEHESDIDGQIEIIKKSIAQKPDAIVLAATDYNRIAPLCEEIEQAGILLIALDSDVNSKAYKSLVSTDNYLLGQKLARLTDENTAANSQIGVIGHVESASTAIERSKGFLDELINMKDRVVDIQYCNGSVPLAIKQATDMLDTYPDITCLVGLNETSALGISYALEATGKSGSVLQYSCDSAQEQIPFMERNVVQGFVVQNPFNMGYLSVEAAVLALDGKPVEPFIDTGSVVITRDTMYLPKNQKLLFPFNESKQSVVSSFLLNKQFE